MFTNQFILSKNINKFWSLASSRTSVSQTNTKVRLLSSSSNAPNILLTGGLGQIGSELATRFREIYGAEHVWVSDICKPPKELRSDPEFKFIFADVLSPSQLEEIIVNNSIDWLVHLPSILSARGELDPELAWAVNIEGVRHAFELGVRHKLRLFIPSSIAVFGSTTPKENTPITCPLDPDTMYGITKRAMELLGVYYKKTKDLDFRSLRYPGVISHETPPGGGTTDYAIDIFYKAIKQGHYTCFLEKQTSLPMMLMEDCLDATVRFIQAEPEELSQRPIYNITSLSFTPQELAAQIKKHQPNFRVQYSPDYRQKIADTWPASIDDSEFRKDLGWQPKFGSIDSLTKVMYENLYQKLNDEKNKL